MTSAAPAHPADPLDALILEAGNAEWCKVAVFISKVVDAAKAQAIETSGQAVAARLYILVEQGQLEAQGNVRRWRAASVKRKSGAPDAFTASAGPMS